MPAANSYTTHRRAQTSQANDHELTELSTLESIDASHDLGTRDSQALNRYDEDDTLLLLRGRSSTAVAGKDHSRNLHDDRHKHHNAPRIGIGHRGHSLFTNVWAVIQENARLSRQFIQDHNPFTSDGRLYIRNLALRSGPAYQFPSLESEEPIAGQTFTGWRMGALFNLILLCVCLLAEVIMLVIAIVKDRDEDGSTLDGIVFSGSCEVAKRWRNPVAVCINILATITIGTSNYMMQCLSAPTGPEIRYAHSNGDHLRVGVSSPLNIEYISRARSFMWWVMGITSVPIHLLFNSAFYSTLQANNYAIAVFTSDFDTTASWNACQNATTNNWSNLTCDLRNKYASFDRMEVSECIGTYSVPVLNSRSSVILVSSVTSSQRNDTLERLWSGDRTFRDSNLQFTSSHRSDGSAAEVSNFENSLEGLNGLLGIFTAFDYGSWNDNYRSGIVWELNQTAVGSAVANATFLNSTSFSGVELQQMMGNGSIQDMTYLYVTFLDGTKVEARTYNRTAQGDIFLNGTAYTRGILAPTRPSFDPTSWLCFDNSTEACTKEVALKDSSPSWRVSPQGSPIDYCLSEKSQKEVCEFRYSGFILGMVIGCDVIKILTILWALRSKEQPLVTIGDVISYFMQNPEPLTKMRCLLSQQDTKMDEFTRAQLFQELDDKPCWSEKCLPIKSLSEEPSAESRRRAKDLTLDELFNNAKPKVWRIPKLRWFNAVSRWGWLYLYFVILSALSATAAVFASGFRKLQSTGGGSIWERGFVTPDPNAVFTSGDDSSSAGGFLKQVIIVNSPQLFFSLMYFTYNATFTVMHSAEEWSGFATDRKALRVSDPKPGQRSSYWLNLPWSYSVPLIAVSALLHWMVSRSLYLVNIKVLGPYGTVQPDQTIFACGYSPIFMTLVLGLLFIMLLAIWAFSLRPLRGDIPLIGANSLTISAVCHGPDSSEAEVCKPLLWGVTQRAEKGVPGHCALSSGEVLPPVLGREYY